MSALRTTTSATLPLPPRRLQTTLDMDREYGFADDAEDNYRLLLQWSNKPAGSEQIAALMKDFPERSVTLSFGWRESDASLTLQTDVSQLAGTDLRTFPGVENRAAPSAQRLGELGGVLPTRDPHVEFDELPAGELLANIVREFSRPNAAALS